MIHPTALVDPKAEIGENVDIGPYSVIEKRVSIGEGTKIGPHVVIREGTQIGRQCQIYQFCSIGEAPQATAYRGEPTLLQVGDHNIIREFVTLHRGSVKGAEEPFSEMRISSWPTPTSPTIVRLETMW